MELFRSSFLGTVSGARNNLADLKGSAQHKAGEALTARCGRRKAPLLPAAR